MPCGSPEAAACPDAAPAGAGMATATSSRSADNSLMAVIVFYAAQAQRPLTRRLPGPWNVRSAVPATAVCRRMVPAASV